MALLRVPSSGPSPRGRGKQVSRSKYRRSHRAIPAWAGKTDCGGSLHIKTPGHPRVGGENCCLVGNPRSNRGPSPRGRGKLSPPFVWVVSRRAIPAWAGKTHTSHFAQVFSAGHPRVGGENSRQRRRTAPESGPSPRGRGKLARRRGRRGRGRAIPAWAGKTESGLCGRGNSAGHPRVGGENLSTVRDWILKHGPSPRGRGKRRKRGSPAGLFRAIPAWAGKTPPSACSTGRHSGHPRVGGENGGWKASSASVPGPSPRGRGKPANRASEPFEWRAIPAWAGKTT